MIPERKGLKDLFMATNIETPAEVKAQCEQFRSTFMKLKAEIGKVVVGHSEVVEAVLMSLFAGGNVLLEGVPGLVQRRDP